MKYQYLLFDWDGTLAHSLPAWITAVRRGLLTRGINPSDSDLMHAIHSLTPGLPRLGVTDTEACIEEIIAYDEITTIYTRPLHDGIRATLDALQESSHIKKALVTNSTADLIEASFGTHDLHTYFQSVVTADRVNVRKPHPEPVLKALDELGARHEKEYALMIGDSVTDVLAGRAAHVKTAIHYPAAHEKFYTLAEIRELKPDYIIRDFAELLDLV